MSRVRGNLSCTVLRGESDSNVADLLDQMLENKQKFISQIMTSKSPVRSCQDLDEVSLSYAEIKALSAGNPLIKEKMDLDIEVGKLKMLKASHQNLQFDLQDMVTRELPGKISSLKEDIENYKKDIEHFKEQPIQLDEKGKIVFPSITLYGKKYTDKEEAGKALIEACKKAVKQDLSKAVEVGSYRGFKLSIGYNPLNQAYAAILEGTAKHKNDLGNSESGNFTRLDNMLEGMEHRIEKMQQALESLTEQLENSKQQLNVPFPHEEELATKEKRLEELTAILESAANESTSSEINEIIDPLFMEVRSENDIQALKDSGLLFERRDSDEGRIIIKLNRSDGDKARNIIGLSPSGNSIKM